MSAINIDTQIPNSIVTLEQLFTWSALSLSRIYPSLAVLETDIRSELVMQNGIFTAADKSTRMLIRASIELDPAYVSDNTKKLWMHAKEFGQVQIPAAFTTN